MVNKSCTSNASGTASIPPSGAETPVTGPSAIAIDARRVVAELFPDLGLRTFRRLVAAANTPRDCRCGGRVFFVREHLVKWANWGFPLREEFERRLSGEGRYDVC